jgi:cardiolipin synthase A/B
MARRSPLAPPTDRHPHPDRPLSERLRQGWRWRAPRFLKALLIIVAIVTLALLFAQDQETLRVESPLGAADPAFPDYAAALTGSGLTRGDLYDILTNGVQILPAMLEAIRQARHRISFESYIYDGGSVAADFTTALADAASRGVEVRLIVDAVGASAMERSHVERLQAAGVRIGTFNPLRWYSIEEINYRTHRKILVVDGEVGFTGGAGVADHWEGNADSPAHWRDTHVRVTGPAVTLLEACFYENWAETGHVSDARLDLRPAPPETRARSIVAWSSPSGGSNRVKLLYLLALAAARQTIDLQSPYVVLDESTRWSLLEARRRGVRVRLLVEGDLTDAKPVKYASRADYEELLASGIEIHEYQPTMMHVKALVVDGIWSVTGSANFDNRSLELNDEVAVAIAHTGVAARLTDDFEADLRRSTRLKLDAWRARPLSDKAHEKFWSLFGELF